jgi:MFS family permease
MINVGAFPGIYCFSHVAQRLGRRPTFAISFVLALLSTAMVFMFLKERSQVFWMMPIMGFCQLSLFGGYAVYFPELFPTRLRSTGTSFCYNVGRFIAATGPFTLGVLQKALGDKAIAALPLTADAVLKADAKLSAFREAACWLSAIYLMGLLVLPFLPETKGRAMPED